MYTINEILNIYKKIDPYIIKETEDKIKSDLLNDVIEVKELSEQEIDFIVRPIVAATLLAEVEKDNIQSLSSIDGIINSGLSDEDKYKALRKYALNIGFKPISKTWNSLLREIVYFIKNNWFSLKTPLINQLFKEIDNLYKVYIVDSNTKEMVRNNIPLTRFPDTLINNFKKDDSNPISLIDHSFSRKDLESYLLAKQDTTILLPNFIDIYMLFEPVNKTIQVNKNKDNNLYVLPKDMYISISHSSKEIGISNSNIDFYYGVVEREVGVYVVDGEETEEFNVVCFDYQIPNIDKLFINNSNLMFKGFYPFFLNLKILTEETINQDLNKNLFNDLKNFFKEKAFDLEINVTDINKIIKNYYKDGICSSLLNGELYLTTNFSQYQQLSFPISIKDLNLNVNFPIKQISEFNLAVFLKSIKVTNES